MTKRAPVLYLPHGGGPLPVLGDPGHEKLVAFLTTIPERLGNPDAILVISAHWEADVPNVTTASRPGLLYDYSGFPPESYTIQYPAPGDPDLAQEIISLLGEFSATGAPRRDFDHGMFIPLRCMYPTASLPCVQLSLLRSLDPAEHIRMGRALRKLREKNILVIGSGLSFHNLRTFFHPDAGIRDKSAVFQEWLLETCTAAAFSENERTDRLRHWRDAPEAAFCHPREEHLLPLHVCFGMAGEAAAEVVFYDDLMNIPVISLLWS